MSFSTPFLVAAIDFGTTSSGYLYSFRHEFIKDPLRICTSVWNNDYSSKTSFKTPSVVLLKPNKTFYAFGYEAQNIYEELQLDDKHVEWLFFKRFTMSLHQNKSLRRTTTIKDVNGEEMPAMAIFTMAIKYLKDHLMETLAKNGVPEITEDILWVVTVPAILDEGAKQFMTEAAVGAGVPKKQLLLVSRPHAAVLYWTISMKDGEGGTDTDLFKPGTQFMVLNLGGTLVDITVLEVQSNQNLREIHHATDGTMGGTTVNDAFYQFLAELYGNHALTTFKNEWARDDIDLILDFEKLKRTFDPDLKIKTTIKVPVSLCTTFEEQTGEKLKEAVSRTRYARRVYAFSDILKVDSQIVKEFFSQTLQEIIQHVTEIMQAFQGDSVSKILLVGGFSESPMVLKAIRKSFPNKKVITPAEPGLAVMKGAVLFGHTPNTFSYKSSRKSAAVSSGIGM